MGLASAALGGGDMSRATVPAGPGYTAPFMLPATYMTGAGAYVRIRTDWLSTYYLPDGSINTAWPTRNLYFGVRMSQGADWLASIVGNLPWNGAVTVHDVDASLDVDPLAAAFGPDRKVNFTTYISPNNRTVLARYQSAPAESSAAATPAATAPAATAALATTAAPATAPATAAPPTAAPAAAAPPTAAPAAAPAWCP
ncbi:hypothetical protein HYH03_007678 [Edaphochlamys debaryana]|uniref:Peptidase M11 gametolysin domain-containing protein n=1 Tax=Edaphochlamys debaryana TaxID=47281 RepID=A0A835Y4K3_9CHLO|nr:hypothetical protein HYH03_007678 [Edaphochlamys debaryana]|eukprot:KAG2494031.1 hypothetical protein HYH03_007678 [Edaphochlamys debaryana]